MAVSTIKKQTAIQPLTVEMGSTQTSATFNVGNFNFGFLIGYYRVVNPSANALSGHCIIYNYKSEVYIDAKTDFTVLDSVSFSNGILTVNTNTGYMTLAFLPLL